MSGRTFNQPGFNVSVIGYALPNNGLWVNADGSINVRGAPFVYTPLGYEQIVNPSTATNLTPPPGATMALIAITVAPVRWRDDGTSPTASVGMPLVAGQEFQYSGDLDTIQFINQSGAATIDVSYYS